MCRCTAASTLLAPTPLPYPTKVAKIRCVISAVTLLRLIARKLSPIAQYRPHNGPLSAALSPQTSRTKAIGFLTMAHIRHLQTVPHHGQGCSRRTGTLNCLAATKCLAAAASGRDSACCGFGFINVSGEERRVDSSTRTACARQHGMHERTCTF